MKDRKYDPSGKHASRFYCSKCLYSSVSAIVLEQHEKMWHPTI